MSWRKKQTASLAEDPTLGDPLARRVHELLDAGNWSEAHPIIEAMTPEEREWVIWSASVLPGAREWLDVWVVAEGDDSAVPWMVRAVRRSHLAWKRLGPHPPNDLADAVWVRFYRALQDSEADLEIAAKVAPTDPVPWSFLVATSRGLLAPLHRLCARMEEVEVRDPLLPLANFEFVRALGPSWGGTTEMMWEATRPVARAAPMGSAAHAVIPIAHLETWRVIANADAADRYLDNGQVATEIAEAAEQSVARRAFGTTGVAALARHAFLVAWCVIGDHERAREQFAILGDTVAPWPWDYLDADPYAAYAAQRTRVT